VTIYAQFRVYHNVSESISDHAALFATSGYYQQAMADRAVPDAFANDLTGVYATDPDYGSNLIAIMRLYNLHRSDVSITPVVSRYHPTFIRLVRTRLIYSGRQPPCLPCLNRSGCCSATFLAASTSGCTSTG